MIEKQREEERQKHREGFSYLDLESGTLEGSRSTVSMVEQSRSEARRSIKLTIPEQPHFKHTEQDSPNTPFTPYTVRVGQRVLPQYSQATVIESRPQKGRSGGRKQKQRNWPTASEEKRRLAEAQLSVALDSGASSSSAFVRQGESFPSPTDTGNHPPQLPNFEPRFRGSVGTFGITNISPRTISAPPPYAL